MMCQLCEGFAGGSTLIEGAVFLDQQRNSILGGRSSQRVNQIIGKLRIIGVERLEGSYCAPASNPAQRFNCNGLNITILCSFVAVKQSGEEIKLSGMRNGHQRIDRKSTRLNSSHAN